MSNMIRMMALSALLLSTTACAGPVHDMVVAAQMDNVTQVKKLLGKGISPNTVDPVTGETVLMIALREGSQSVAAELIADGRLALERQAPNGNTALMMAAFKRNQAAVLALIARGAVITRPGWTALHYAAASGDTEIAAILLEHHAYIDAASPSQLTPLMIAAREGQRDVAEQLLRAGADARLRNNENLTASQIAVRANYDAIGALIDRHVAVLPIKRSR
ncbi:MAG: ankyrin repeat domain-containing protein [Telluria sp.]